MVEEETSVLMWETWTPEQSSQRPKQSCEGHEWLRRRPVCSCQRHELWNSQARDLSNRVRDMNGWGGDQCVHVRDMNSGIAKPETLVLEWGTWTHEPCNGWGGSPFFLLRTSCCLLFFICGWFCTVFFIRVRHRRPATKNQGTDITPVAAMQWCGWQGIFGHVCSYYPCGCYAVVWMARDIWARLFILPLWLLCSGVNGKGYLGMFVHITPVAAMQWCGWQRIFGHVCSYYPCGCYAVVWMARDIWARLFILPLWLLCSGVDGKGYLGTFVHITPVAAMQWCEWQGIFGHVCSYYPCGCYAVVWMARDIWARLFILPLWLLCSGVNGKGYLGTFVHAYVGKQLHTHIYICTKHLWIFVHICS